MTFGLSGAGEDISFAAAAEYDFYERWVGKYLCPLEDEKTFADIQRNLNASLPTPVVNRFLPGSLPVVGPDVNRKGLETYCAIMFERAETAGVEKIVLGSGAQRKIPEGFSRTAALEQIKDFILMAEGIARARGVLIVLEPLNRRETNLFTTVKESADFVREIDRPNFKLLADLYHMMMENEDPQAIVDNVDIIRHMHIATAPNRLIPGLEACELPDYLAAVKQSGYDGRLAIEARSEASMDVLKSAKTYMTT